VLYHTCTTLFFSGFLTWLKMDLRSCTLYYNFTSASKTLEMPFQCTKILKNFRVAYLRTFLIWSPSPPLFGMDWRPWMRHRLDLQALSDSECVEIFRCVNNTLTVRLFCRWHLVYKLIHGVSILIYEKFWEEWHRASMYVVTLTKQVHVQTRDNSDWARSSNDNVKKIDIS
jgi:hypothetical protein